MKAQDRRRLVGLVTLWAVVTALNAVFMPARYTVQISAETVASAPLALVVRAPGTVEAKASIAMKAPFDASLASKSFHEGEKVAVGQTLLVLNRDKIRLDYQQKQDALANAKADLTQARKEVRLQQSLFDQQAVASSAVEEAQRNLVKAQQTLRSAEEAAKLEQTRWDSAVIVSPVAGTVVHDAVGDDRSIANGKDLVTIADISEFTVKARVDELDIKRLSEGLLADVRLPLYPQNVFKARVTQIASQPDATDSAAIPVVLKIEDTQGVLLRPKLSADVRILTGQTPPVLSVPLSAIHNADGTARVWVLGLGDRLRARKVALGQTTPDRAEVKEGLKAGERICTTAEASLAEGMHVQVKR